MRTKSPMWMSVALPVLIVAAGSRGAAGAAPDPYAPSDAERARWTMSDMKSLALALDAYRLDHGAYPAAAVWEEARHLLQPLYMRSVPSHDAWGTPYRYVPAADRAGYVVASAGADRLFDDARWTPEGESAGFEEDAVLRDGRITRSWPYR